MDEVAKYRIRVSYSMSQVSLQMFNLQQQKASSRGFINPLVLLQIKRTHARTYESLQVPYMFGALQAEIKPVKISFDLRSSCLALMLFQLLLL
jgi:hypothetical protein